MINSWTEDLLKYGLIPEFVGRLPVDHLHDLKSIISSRSFWNLKMPWSVSTRRCSRLKTWNWILPKAESKPLLKKQSNERPVPWTVQSLKVMLDTMYEVPSDPSVQQCIVEAETSRNSSPNSSIVLIRQPKPSIRYTCPGSFPGPHLLHPLIPWKDDVYGVCNPLIDLLCHIPDEFLQQWDLEKTDYFHGRNIRSWKNWKIVVSNWTRRRGSGANTWRIAQPESIQHLRENWVWSRGDQYRNDLEDKGVSCIGSRWRNDRIKPDPGFEWWFKDDNTPGMCQELEPDDIDGRFYRQPVSSTSPGSFGIESQKLPVRHALEMAEIYPLKSLSFLIRFV